MVLSPEWLRTTLLVWAAWCATSLAYTMFNVYLPKLLETRSPSGGTDGAPKTLEESLWDVVIYSLGGCPGAILGAWLIESRLGRRWSLAGSTFVTAFFCWVFVVVQHPWAVRASTVGISLSATAMWAVLYGWTPEIFGTKVRGTACGIASALSRISSEMTFQTHLTVLQHSASLYTSSPAFKVPRLSSDSGCVEEWAPISYQQFLEDVELSARYWSRTLTAHDVLPRSVVGVWLGDWGESLTAQLNRIEGMPDAEKDAALKAYTVALGQADIALLKKNELRDRLASVRKAFDKHLKDKEAAANKAAVDALQQYFKDKPEAPAYFAILDVNANAKVMQGVVLQAKKLGKSIYVLSVDASAGKVAHVNAVSEEAKAKGLDGREWAAAVVEVVGGKAGGKPDGAQGVGTEVSKVQEAFDAARKFFESKTGLSA
ncbi:hypothetical protein NUW54_g4803 [Trametes sanguinea]|uniref:Uncharacterized protein n=1 Tax=Trametes sanguinea TaxID=158606 RepID=A0ACC1PZ12_9APHY|nr:hypothetical protein NUW54_g4803 [Trametes sanguinea]